MPLAPQKHAPLTEAEITRLCNDAVDRHGLAAPRLLVLIPDLTRSCPLDLLFPILYARLAPRVRTLDFLVALGTHPPLSPDQMLARVGIDRATHAQRYAKARFFNHQWDNPAELTCVGRIDRAETRALSGGLFELDIDVTVNRRVLDYDQLLIIGPVFPHEVVGFSGGNKYLFPGISGPELLHFFHWLGAVITNPRIIGCKDTPVRRILDRAASLLPLPRKACCMVVQDGGLAGLYFGSPEQAWSEAADLSAHLHIIRTPRAYHTVLSCAPVMYDDLWVGAKCMYKLEPALADGADIIIYAPHIREVSATHGSLIRQVGYHTRDYFLRQWGRFKDIPWGILAHSTHVKGIGSYLDGVEQPRVNVILATGIPEHECRAVNLAYRDPHRLRPDDFAGREDEGVLMVPKAGEILYRWKDAPPELGG